MSVLISFHRISVIYLKLSLLLPVLACHKATPVCKYVRVNLFVLALVTNKQAPHIACSHSVPENVATSSLFCNMLIL